MVLVLSLKVLNYTFLHAYNTRIFSIYLHSHFSFTAGYKWESEEKGLSLMYYNPMEETSLRGFEINSKRSPSHSYLWARAYVPSLLESSVEAGSTVFLYEGKEEIDEGRWEYMVASNFYPDVLDCECKAKLRLFLTKSTLS